MHTCSFDDIRQRWDELVDANAADWGIDPICSRSEWIEPQANAFASTSPQRIFESDEGCLAFIERTTPRGKILTSFDPVWGFATPMVGNDPVRIVDGFAEVVRRLGVYAVVLSGITDDSPLAVPLQGLGPRGAADPTRRCIVELDDGVDAWLDRRSPRFRRSVRVALRDTADANVTMGMTVVDAANVDDVIGRILNIEAASWKHDAASGLIGTELGTFTIAMIRRFASTGRARVLIAEHKGTDVGYVVGARVGARYRGFQHSFDNDLRSLSLGKAMQHHNLAALSSEGVRTYDMGMYMGYKESYADRIETSSTLIFTG